MSDHAAFLRSMEALSGTLSDTAIGKVLATAYRIDQLEAALTEIDREGSGVSPECEALADIARRALEADR